MQKTSENEISRALLVASENMIHCTRKAQSCPYTLSLVSNAQKASLEDGEETLSISSFKHRGCLALRSLFEQRKKNILKP